MADPLDVQGLLLMTAAAISIILGYLGAGHGVAVASGPWTTVPWLTLAVVGVAAAAWGGRRAALVAVVLLGLSRGGGAGVSTVAEAAVGPPPPLLVLHVTQRARPGARCVVRGRVPGGARASVVTGARHCPVPAGATIVAPRPRIMVPDRWLLEREAGPVYSARTIVFDGRAPPAPRWEQLGVRVWREGFASARGDDGRALVRAATLGLPSALSTSARGKLRAAGLGHLIAVSGLHVGLCMLAVGGVLRRLGAAAGLPGGPAIVVSWAALLLYVMLTGASPPAVRAGLMIMAWNLGALLGRPHHGPTLLAFAAVSMLAFDPALCLDPGFQLSLCAMAGLLTAPASLGLAAVSWRVSWAVAPVTVVHFGHAAIAGFAANVVAIPVFALWVLPLGLVGALPVPGVAPLSDDMAALGGHLLLDLAALVSALPTPSGVSLLAVGVACTAIPRLLSWPGLRPVAPPRLALAAMAITFAAGLWQVP